MKTIDDVIKVGNETTFDGYDYYSEDAVRSMLKEYGEAIIEMIAGEAETTDYYGDEVVDRDGIRNMKKWLV